MFWDTVNPWFEDSGILKPGKRYWVQKEEPVIAFANVSAFDFKSVYIKEQELSL